MNDLRCPEVNPCNGVQCGLPVGHLGSHHNGTLTPSWSTEPERPIQPAFAFSILGRKLAGVVSAILLLCAGCFAELPEAPSSQAHRSKASEWAVYSAPFVSTVLDVETTQAAIGRGCVEANTLFYGSHPSRARMYATNIPISVGAAMLSHYLRKKSSRAWWIPSVAYSSFHVAGGVHNVGLRCGGAR